MTRQRCMAPTSSIHLEKRTGPSLRFMSAIKSTTAVALQWRRCRLGSKVVSVPPSMLLQTKTRRTTCMALTFGEAQAVAPSCRYTPTGLLTASCKTLTTHQSRVFMAQLSRLTANSYTLLTWETILFGPILSIRRQERLEDLSVRLMNQVSTRSHDTSQFINIAVKPSTPSPKSQVK
jgi:hypothetical protein